MKRECTWYLSKGKLVKKMLQNNRTTGQVPFTPYVLNMHYYWRSNVCVLSLWVYFWSWWMRVQVQSSWWPDLQSPEKWKTHLNNHGKSTSLILTLRHISSICTHHLPILDVSLQKYPLRAIRVGPVTYTCTQVHRS